MVRWKGQLFVRKERRTKLLLDWNCWEESKRAFASSFLVEEEEEEEAAEEEAAAAAVAALDICWVNGCWPPNIWCNISSCVDEEEAASLRNLCSYFFLLNLGNWVKSAGKEGGGGEASDESEESEESEELEELEEEERNERAKQWERGDSIRYEEAGEEEDEEAGEEGALRTRWRTEEVDDSVVITMGEAVTERNIFL